MLDASKLVFFDFESRAPGSDLRAAGTIRYATAASTSAIVLTYAIGDGPEQVWHADGGILDWSHAPDHLQGAFARRATFAAWNASFDSAIWNYATVGFPFLEPERVIDVMIQAGVSNLPTDLESASRYIGSEGKQKDGKQLIKLFCTEGANPRDYPEEWQRFLAYARRDTTETRKVYSLTRPLPDEEWQQYWAFERINRRGVCIDLPFVLQAERLAIEDVARSGHRLAELTNREVTSVNQAKRIASWLYRQLPDPAMREALLVGLPTDEDDGDTATLSDESEEEKPELSLTRDRVADVLAILDAKHANGGLAPGEAQAREVATLRLYGAGASPKKFARLNAQHVNGVLRDQYRFAGAGQTGRLSSKAAQIHNLTRDVLGADGAQEAHLVDAIADGCSYEAVAACAPADVPVARKLALLVRPALIAGPGKLFVWSDWSAIEARITPWLAASAGGDAVLDIFRANDADPSLPDVYVIAAANILHKRTSEITKPERQTGKVAVLALAFGGSVGALLSMALAYGIHLDEDEARRIVNAWREANPWARSFWDGLWDAALGAWNTPGMITTAGRTSFVYLNDYLEGALFMALPSGRILTYPGLRWREVEVLDRKTKKPTGKRRTELSFRRAHGRAKLWSGTFCENATQACAADILRQTVTRIETSPTLAFMRIRMTCHDEIVCEVDEARANEAKALLRAEMLTLPAWANGLPLQSEESICAYYTKAKTALRQPR
jgi:DNA polymerase